MRFLRGGYNCLMPAKTNISWIADAMEEVLPSLGSHLCRVSKSVQGKIVSVDFELAPTDKRRVGVHVFRDRLHAIANEAELFEDLAAFEEEWANCNEDVILDARGVGHSALVQKACWSSLDMPPRAGRCCDFPCAQAYGQCDCIEKCFMAGKTDLNMDVLRAHSTHTKEGASSCAS